MALPISMFTKGVLITTPPLIYIFVGDIPMNSLVGGVASTSQESNMNSDDPNALPRGDSINSDVLPPTPVNPPENKALPPSDQAVDDGNAKESDPGVPTAEPVVDNVAKEKEPGVSTGDSVVDSGDVKDTNPKVSEDVSQESPGVSKGSSQDSAPVADGLPKVDDDEDTDDEEEDPTGDTSKNEELNKKLGEAGIDSSCFLESLKTVGKCTLTEEQMLKINFPQKDEDDDDLEISGLEDDEKVTLTIESGYDDGDFPEGLRLTFHNPNSKKVNITGSASNDTDLEPNIDYDFKFSLAINNWIDRAWNSLQKLGAKVGLNINDSKSDDPCATGKEINKKLNIWKSRKEYVIGAVSTSSENCLMKSTENNQNHLEGFILTVRDNKDISLTGGNGPSEGKTIDTLKKNVTYSIGPKRVGGKKVWFLIENK